MTPVWKQRFGCGYAAPGTRWRAACQSRDSSLCKRMGGIPHPQAWPSVPLPHLDPLPTATRTHLPPPFPVFHTRHAEQSAERPRLVTVVRPCGHSTLRKVTLLLNRRSVVSYEQLLLDISEALGFPRWHRARVTRLYTPHAREVRGVCDFFRGEAAFLALGKSRPELRSVEEALEELFPQHSCYRNDALRAWERRLQPSPDKAAKADSGYSEGTDIHTHPDKDTHTSLDTNTQTYSVTYTQGCHLDTHTHTHQDTLTQPNTHPKTLTHHNTHPNRRSTHKNKHPTRQPIHPIHTHLDTDAHTHTHPNTHSNQHSTHPSHPANHLQRVKVKVAAREILSSPIGPSTQEEELGEELDTPPPPLCRNCKPSEGPNPRAGRAPLPPVTRKQTGNGPNNQEVEKPHVGPTPLHTGPICRLEQESFSQSEPSSSASKQEEARTKQEVIFDLPFDGSDVTLSDIERCYDIGRVVGDGNFAVVHECHRRDNGEAFAVKIVEHSKLIGREHMMQNELSLLGSLSHPRVVRLFTHHHTHTHSYLVMEMVAGGDLFEAIAVRGKFPEEEAGLMVCDVSEALRYIHSKTIVHRDLKPENLLVECSSHGVSRLKLGDFGLAMVVTEPIFTVCGTPTYVAPEILSETGYGLPVDLWALGVILYVLLCGFPPFRSRDRDQGELFQMIREAHLTFLSPYWDDISDGARGLVRALLQVDPTERLTAVQTLMHPWIQTTTDQYRPTQTTTDQYRPTQTTSDQYRPTQTTTDQYRPTQTTTDQYRPTQTTTDQYRPTQTTTDQYRPTQSTTDQYRPTQTTTDQYRPTQTTTDQYRPTQISADQQSPAQPSKVQHRHEPISANQQSPAKTSTEHYRPVQSPTTGQSRPAQTTTEHHGPVPTPDQQRPPHPIPPAHHPPTQPAPSPHSGTQPAPSPHSTTQPAPSTPPQPHSSSTSQPPHPISPPSILSTATPKPSSLRPGRTPQSALPLYPASLPPPTLPPSQHPPIPSRKPTQSQHTTHPPAVSHPSTAAPKPHFPSTHPPD
eukprot:XP_014033541.1 PREDICTED: 3-phosphoinositide-dependent protein kinase B-like [Salmo salar]